MFSSTLVTTILTLTSLAFAAPAPAPAPAAEVATTFNGPAPYDFISLTTAGKNVPAALMNANSNSLVKRNVGGVRMSDGKDFTGHVWYGIYPLNTCIDLRDYAGHVLSFRPDEGNECLLMQGRCNGNDEFADMYYNSTNIGDLSEYYWIGEVTSYICLEE